MDVDQLGSPPNNNSAPNRRAHNRPVKQRDDCLHLRAVAALHLAALSISECY
jgi:hypothetical protein